MAEAKPKKTDSSKKIVDVKPDGNGASGTSRPVIVTNRPILKDPMMAEVSQLTGGAMDDSQTPTPTGDAPAEPASGAPEITLSTKKLAIKVSEDTDATEEKTKTSVPIEVPVKKKVIKPLGEQSSEKPAVKPAKKAPTIAELTLPDADEVPDVTAEAVSPDSEVPPAEDEAAATEEIVDTAAVTAEPTTTVSSKETPAEPSAEDEVVTGVQPGRSFDEAAEETLPDTTTPPAPEQIELDSKGKPKTKSKKSGELSSEQQKAIEHGEYFLPITTAETRRLRREVVLATLFVGILIIVWLDIMLDAGLLSIDGIKAVTNFF